jgi:hypothetical protein
VTILSVPRPSPELLRGLTREALEPAAAGAAPHDRPDVPAWRASDAHAAIESRATLGKTLLADPHRRQLACRAAPRGPPGRGPVLLHDAPQGSRTAPASFPRQRRSPWAAWLFSAPTRRTRASTSSSPHSSTGRGIPPEDAVDLPITGTPAQAAERFAAYACAGAIWLVLGTISDDWHAQWKLIAEAAALLD